MFDNNRKTAMIAAVLAAITIFIASLLVNGGNVIIGAISALLGIPAFFLANMVFARYRSSLSERANPPTEQPTHAAAIMWDVRMNDVLVGQVADRELAEIQDTVASDWRNMAAQAINVLGVPLRVFDKLLAAVPAIAFWLILACALFDPNSLIQTLTAIHQASAHEIQQGVSTGVSLLCMFGLILFVLSYAFNGYAYGLRNVYRAEFGNRLRKHLKIAATGDLTIERIADGTYSAYEPDLLGWYRASSRAKKNKAATR